MRLFDNDESIVLLVEQIEALLEESGYTVNEQVEALAQAIRIVSAQSPDKNQLLDEVVFCLEED